MSGGAHIAHEVHKLGNGELNLHAHPDKPGHVTLTHGGRSITLNEAEQRRLSHALTRSSRAEHYALRHEEHGGKLHSTPLYRVTHGGEDSEGVARQHTISVAHPDDSYEDVVNRPALSLTDRQAEHLDQGLARMSESQRVDTGNGPLDVYATPDHVGLRMKDEAGKPTEVEFGEQDWQRISHALDVLADGVDQDNPDPNAPEINHVTVQTSAGPVDLDWRGPHDEKGYSPNAHLVITPQYPADWSVAVDGARMAEVFGRMSFVADAAGIDTSAVTGPSKKWLTVRAAG